MLDTSPLQGLFPEHQDSAGHFLVVFLLAVFLTSTEVNGKCEVPHVQTAKDLSLTCCLTHNIKNTSNNLTVYRNEIGSDQEKVLLACHSRAKGLYCTKENNVSHDYNEAKKCIIVKIPSNITQWSKEIWCSIESSQGPQNQNCTFQSQSAEEISREQTVNQTPNIVLPTSNNSKDGISQHSISNPEATWSIPEMLSPIILIFSVFTVVLMCYFNWEHVRQKLSCASGSQPNAQRDNPNELIPLESHSDHPQRNEYRD